MNEFEFLNMDLDGDGYLDAYGEEVDLDGDGVVDSMIIDTNNDLVVDTVMSDTNGDGYFDTMSVDYDGDGYADYIETDTNFDGYTDSYSQAVDTDGDGYAETIVEAEDLNGDGIIDREISYIDEDMNGNFEGSTCLLDTDGDGVFDTAYTAYDYDEDGIVDVNMAETMVDIDGDGIDDVYIYGQDLDNDGTYEAIDVFELDEDSTYIEPLEDVPDQGYNLDGTGLDNFDPETADSDAIKGDPAESMENWESQGSTNRCALYSQKFVIEEITGQDVDIEEIVDIAEENNWFDEEGGTKVLNMNKILEYYDIDNEVSYDNSFEDIENALENGEKIIVSVDADEIWYGDDDSIYNPGDGVNHAVQVIGIDYSDPDQPMVILNDSGTPDGCGEMVPLDTFMDAWEDGSYHMITAV